LTLVVYPATLGVVHDNFHFVKTPAFDSSDLPRLFLARQSELRPSPLSALFYRPLSTKEDSRNMLFGMASKGYKHHKGYFIISEAQRPVDIGPWLPSVSVSWLDKRGLHLKKLLAVTNLMFLTEQEAISYGITLATNWIDKIL
jgi:hypothetical protein